MYRNDNREWNPAIDSQIWSQRTEADHIEEDTSFIGTKHHTSLILF